jgi:hypothetical protein
MGVLKNIFSRNGASRLAKLPSGSFSLDANGRTIVSTLPSSFSEAQMREIGARVLAFFRNANRAQVPVQELNIYYPSLKVTARNLRGGAIIFLSPQTLPKN